MTLFHNFAGFYDLVFIVSGCPETTTGPRHNRFGIEENGMKKYRQGYTLIELMITVAILGILASVGISAFQTYSVRAQVSEGLALSGPVQSAVAEYYNDQGAFPADNTIAGILPADSYTGKYVDSVSVNGAVISILYGNDASAQINGETVTLTAVAALGSLNWDCASGGVIDDTLLPQICR